MKRRALLKAAGGAGVIGSSTLGGCLSAADDAGTGYRWRYDAGGTLDAVSRGVVFARERSDRESPDGFELFDSGPAADGQVVALDAEAGDLEWTYGETGRQSTYTELTVADGVYFGYCGDDDCIGLYALGRDGEERWTEDAGVDRQSPSLLEGVVYVGTDTGVVRAFDAETGAERWTQRVRGPDDRIESSAIVDVADAVYVETASSLVALDRNEGDARWRYDVGDEREPIVDATVSNETAYVVTTDRVAAVADGDEQWRWDFEEREADSRTEIAGIASDRLFVFARNDRLEHRLYAFDIATGERDWVSGPLEHPTEESRPEVAVHEEVVYVGADRLHALDAATGDERWSVTLESGPIQSVTVVEADGAEEDDHTVFVHADETRLLSFTPGGERRWNGSVDETIRNYLVNEFVFVATDEGIYALDR